MKRLLYFILIIEIISTFTTSCVMDYFVFAEVSNKTSDTIHLKLEYDTMFIKKNYNYSKNKILSAPHADSGIIILKTDSIKYIKDIIIYPNRSTIIGGGTATPQMWYSKITIFHKKDSTVIAGRENIDKSFKKTDGNEFTYLIK